MLTDAPPAGSERAESRPTRSRRRRSSRRHFSSCALALSSPSFGTAEEPPELRSGSADNAPFVASAALVDWPRCSGARAPVCTRDCGLLSAQRRQAGRALVAPTPHSCPAAAIAPRSSAALATQVGRSQRDQRHQDRQDQGDLLHPCRRARRAIPRLVDARGRLGAVDG